MILAYNQAAATKTMMTRMEHWWKLVNETLKELQSRSSSTSATQHQWDSWSKRWSKTRRLPLYATKPGLREIKQVELWSKYRPLIPKEYRDECCPRPCKEVIEREKNKKKANGKLKRDEKKEKQNLTVAARMPIVMATTASTTTASSGDQQTLTIHDTPLSPSKRSHEEAGLSNSG